MNSLLSLIKNFAAACSDSAFLGFPTWYKYLQTDDLDVGDSTICTPMLGSLNDIWLVGLAVIEILLRVGILVAIAYVVVGGVKFIDARGDTGGGGKPDKINTSKQTVLDGLKGVVICVAATAVVSFIAGRFTQ